MDELIERLDVVRSAAARFYAVDLHLHSPYSHDWNNSGSNRDERLDHLPVGKPIPADAVAAYRASCIASGRELVAVTDHNISAFGVAAAKANGGDELVVLPGIELTVVLKDTPLIKDHRIHVVAVFPPEMHEQAFGRILPDGTPAEDKRDPRGTLPYASIEEVIEKIEREGGIAIAAHVEAKNGLRGVYKLTTELLLEPIGGTPEAAKALQVVGTQVKDELKKFAAVQVRPTVEASHYLRDGSLIVPLIVATDCEKGSELPNDQSDRYTYIKMACPSFPSLVEALKYPDLRVRLKEALPESRPPRMLGVRLHGSGFFVDTTLGFSDNLTCLIGPRGSGKSAAIDGIRYLMGYNRGLESEVPSVERQVRDRQRATLERTRIEALYQCVDGHMYRLSATYDSDEDYATEVYDLEGNRLNIPDVEKSGQFPLNLYGWGEMELLAENPETQRELLDRFIPGIDGLKEDKGRVLGLLEANRAEVLGVVREMDEYFTKAEKDFLRTHEFKDKFDALDKPAIRKVFTELDTIQERRALLRKITKKIGVSQKKGKGLETLGVGELLAKETLDAWGKRLAERIKPDEIDDWVRVSNAEFEKRVAVIVGIIDAEDEKLSKQEEDAQKRIESSIGDEEAISGDLRANAKRRYEDELANYESYKVVWKRYRALFVAREKLLRELDSVNKSVFATRDSAIEDIRHKVSLVEDEEYRIGLILRQQADRRGFVKAMTDSGTVLFRHQGNWRAERRAEVLARETTPVAFVASVMDCATKAFDGLETELDGAVCHVKHGQQLVTDNCPAASLEGFDVERIDPVRLELLLKLQETPLDDDFYITLADKPIQNCSPGQRCSAMLPVVALTTQAPLIIDQPEDNLDNRLVSNAMFKILASLKETRQVILATHNPNIVVSGDAEQVLLLGSEGETERFGCVDDAEIVKAVIGLMEGGSEAFRRRQTKYSPYLLAAPASSSASKTRPSAARSPVA